MTDYGKLTPGFAHLTPTPAFDQTNPPNPPTLPPDDPPTTDGDPFPDVALWHQMNALHRNTPPAQVTPAIRAQYDDLAQRWETAVRARGAINPEAMRAAVIWPEPQPDAAERLGDGWALPPLGTLVNGFGAVSSTLGDVITAIAALSTADLAAWAVDFGQRTGITPNTPEGDAPILPASPFAQVEHDREPSRPDTPTGALGVDVDDLADDGAGFCEFDAIGDGDDGDDWAEPPDPLLVPEAYQTPGAAYQQRVLFDEPTLIGCDVDACPGVLCPDPFCICGCHLGFAFAGLPVGAASGANPDDLVDPDDDVADDGDDLGTVVDIDELIDPLDDPGTVERLRRDLTNTDALDDDDPAQDAPDGIDLDDRRHLTLSRVERFDAQVDRHMSARFNAETLDQIARVVFCNGSTRELLGMMGAIYGAAFVESLERGERLVASLCADLDRPCAWVRHGDGTTTGYRPIAVYA